MSKIYKLLLVLVFALPNLALAKTASIPQNQDQYIRILIREYIDDPLMEKIAGCESTGNPNQIIHWNTNGSLVKNPGSSASGWAQVLLKYHSGWIASTGLDMQDPVEYTQFVKILLDEQGYSAWNESRSCWGKYSNLGTHW